MSTIIQMGRYLYSGDFCIVWGPGTTHFLREEDCRRTFYEDLQAIVDISLEKSLFGGDAANVSVTILEYIICNSCPSPSQSATIAEPLGETSWSRAPSKRICLGEGRNRGLDLVRQPALVGIERRCDLATMIIVLTHLRCHRAGSLQRTLLDLCLNGSESVLS